MLLDTLRWIVEKSADDICLSLLHNTPGLIDFIVHLLPRLSDGVKKTSAAKVLVRIEGLGDQQLR